MTPAKRDARGSLRKIGEVAKRSDIAVETLRFYESRGLIEPAGRTASAYRLYDDSVFERLAFVKKSQAVGFTLDQIAWIIAEAREGRRPCVEVRKMARQRLNELDEKLTELRRYRRDLKRTLDAWDREGVKEGMICGLIEGLDAAVVRPVSGRAGRWRPSGRRKP